MALAERADRSTSWQCMQCGAVDSLHALHPMSDAQSDRSPTYDCDEERPWRTLPKQLAGTLRLIAYQAANTGYAWEKQAGMARRRGITERTLSTHYRILEQIGLLRRERIKERDRWGLARWRTRLFVVSPVTKNDYPASTLFAWTRPARRPGRGLRACGDSGGISGAISTPISGRSNVIRIQQSMNLLRHDEPSTDVVGSKEPKNEEPTAPITADPTCHEAVHRLQQLGLTKRQATGFATKLDLPTILRAIQYYDAKRLRKAVGCGYLVEALKHPEWSIPKSNGGGSFEPAPFNRALSVPSQKQDLEMPPEGPLEFPSSLWGRVCKVVYDRIGGGLRFACLKQAVLCETTKTLTVPHPIALQGIRSDASLMLLITRTLGELTRENWQETLSLRCASHPAA